MKRFLLFFIFISLIFISAFVAQDIAMNGIKKNSILDEFHPEDSQLLKYKSYQKHFNDQNKLNILFQSVHDSPLSNADLLKMEDFIQTKIAPLQGILNSLSLKDIKIPYLSKQSVRTQALMEKGEINSHVRSLLHKSQTFSDFPISSDNTTLSIPIVIDTENYKSKEIIQSILEEMKTYQLNGQFKLKLFGLEYLRYVIFQEILINYTKLLPIITLITSLIVMFYFRSIKVLFLIITCLLFSFISSASFSYFYQNSLSPFSGMSLLFVFIIGTADVVHLFSKAFQLSHKFSKPLCDVIYTAKKDVLKPCFLTSLTTIVGLSSLVFCPFQTLHHFGVNGVIGIIICFYTSFYLTPFIIHFFKIDIKIKNINLLGHHTTIGIKHPKKTLFVGIFLFIIFALNTNNISFKDSFHKKFVKDHPFTKALETSQEKFKNLNTIEIFGIEKNITVHEYSMLIKEISTWPEVYKVKSQLDLKQDILMNFENPTLSNQFYSQLKYSYLGSLYQSRLDIRKSRAIILFKDSEIQTMLATIQKLEKLLKEKSLDQELTISGFSLLRDYFIKQLKQNYMVSLIFSFIIIFLIFWGAFKSLKMAAIAMIPNLVPPISVIAIMNFLGISADMNLPLICSLALAISVDDTIHFLHEYKAQDKSNTTLQNLHLSLKRITMPLVITTLILSSTMLILSLGNIKLFTHFSLFLSLSLVLALFYDLALLPALILLSNSKNNSVAVPKKE